MCRVEERVYISSDGSRQTFEDTSLCRKAKNGRVCSDLRTVKKEYFPKSSLVPVTRDRSVSPVLSSPPTPAGTGSYPVERRRPKTVDRYISPRSTQNAKPEIIIELGQRHYQTKKYPSFPLAETPLHPANSYQQPPGYTVRPAVRRAHHRHTSSDSSFITSSRAPSLYEVSDRESPTGRRASRYPRDPPTIVHKPPPSASSPTTSSEPTSLDAILDPDFYNRHKPLLNADSSDYSKPVSCINSASSDASSARPPTSKTPHSQLNLEAERTRQQKSIHQNNIGSDGLFPLDYSASSLSGRIAAPEITDRDAERTRLRDFKAEARQAKLDLSQITSTKKEESYNLDRHTRLSDESVARRFSTSELVTTIVSLPPNQPTKKILPKPTEKFPRFPNPIREGVVPHKRQLVGEDLDIPPDARWTKIDRRLVNPEALEEAKERFEERQDCVIVLRVLTRDEIQKLADRTKTIREAREEEEKHHKVQDMHHRSDLEKQQDDVESSISVSAKRTSVDHIESSNHPYKSELTLPKSKQAKLPYEENIQNESGDSAESLDRLKMQVRTTTVERSNNPERNGDLAKTGSELQSLSQSESGVSDNHLPSSNPWFSEFNGVSEADTTSVVSSVFSIQSLASSATDLSKGTGYSAGQIATATRELVAIFQEDAFLVPLYKTAIETPTIGPERLQRNLRRLFKAYAEQLKGEATDSLEYLASRLVSLKSRYLAESIVHRFEDSTIQQTEYIREARDESSDEGDTSAVDDDIFQDLIIFREFLVRSDAFDKLRTQIQQFVMPQESKISRIEEPDGETNAEDPCIELRNQAEKSSYGYLFGLKQSFDQLLINTGQREPPLEPGMHRLRWECKCGEKFSGDLTEFQECGIAALTDRMERSSGVKILSRTTTAGKSNQSYNFQSPSRWIGSAITKLGSSLRRKPQTPTLPQHNNASTANTCPLPNSMPAQQQTLHMMACMHKGRDKKNLYQDRIETIDTDRKLFTFLGEQYIRHRGRFLISLKTVQGIFFVKFRLPKGGNVEVRHHNPCCTNANIDCSCIPPPPKVEPSPAAEYRCIPGPPSTYPPVLPEYLMHLFNSPCEIDEKETWILSLLPKRICGELQGTAGQPAEGWGIYYKEGWDRDMIALIVFMVFTLGSLLFGILWSKFRMDVQGAFGVSAYMGTAASILVAMIAMRADK